jgi:hypothetical protein
MRNFLRILLFVIAGCVLTTLGIIAANCAAEDHAPHALIGAPLDSPLASPENDGKPWRI